MLPIGLIILTVGYSSYHISKSVLEEELKEPQQQMLQIIMKDIDKYLVDSNQVAVKLALDNDVYTFLTSPFSHNYQNIKEVYEKLETITKNTGFIKSIYIYDIPKDNFIAVPQGFSSSSLNFNDANWVEVKDELQNQSMIVKYRDLPDGAVNKGSNLTLFRKIHIKGEARGLIAINLHEKELFSKLNLSEQAPSSSMRFIVDQHHNILHTTNAHHFDKETIAFVQNEIRKGHVHNLSYQDNIFLSHQLESAFTGWQFISVVDEDSILAKSETIRNVVFFVSILALIIGCIAVLLINVTQLKPIDRIKQLLPKNEQSGYRRDLLHLETLIDDLVSDHAQLSQLIKKMTKEAKAKFLSDIQSGKIQSDAEFQEKWHTYFKGWKEKPIHVVLLSIDDYHSWMNETPQQYRKVAKAGLINMMDEVLSPHFLVHMVNLDNDKILMIAQLKEGKVSLKNHLRIALDNVEELLGFSISAGMCSHGAHVDLLKEACQKAELALSYRLYHGYGQVLDYTEVVEENEAEITKEETKTLQALITATEQVGPQDTLEEVNRFFDYVEDNMIHPVPSYQYVAEMKQTLFNSLHVPFPIELEAIKTMHLSDVAKVFQEHIAKQVENINHLQDVKRFNYCEKMVHYMAEHLDEAIGIPEIAESVGISVSLASQWFKEEKQETIYGYLTKLRMQKSEELLMDTDAKIAEIALAVGYQHENSFIRKFREYKKMTPGKFRKMHAAVHNEKEM